jgi:hypothetical protein
MYGFQNGVSMSSTTWISSVALTIVLPGGIVPSAMMPSKRKSACPRQSLKIELGISSSAQRVPALPWLEFGEF